ncbi:MAG: hypothetical protein HUJ51_03495 [Eggerthellaceae bacterium]|nr:hypothetical protein [Eggerthellaceae bacterium]
MVPWPYRNRCPFEDPNTAGLFLNNKIDTGTTEMLRTVNEGVPSTYVVSLNAKNKIETY